ncbi:MAG: excinuclease ABC subunit UvrC [Bacillota bacterium]|nr:excinuclease ABC subunit UvrC [Bacillota bacterium]MDD3297807.1 excinuclease ABC subunit UvrC [Bacillota bacterium]MDD3850826.1 excinuclease ABC subunit UvrC [Bacillota bacterium]MDD4707520.1 excinuclease ABC subunit UvrC [Bacillota bacterium]
MYGKEAEGPGGFPDVPGVYIMKDERGSIIYIGKAKSLKKRVGQYFRDKASLDIKTQVLVNQIESIEYIITETELEALILECNFIKKHRPRYNILLKDDKNFPYIRVTLEEEYPRLMLARKMKKDGSKYFGPYRSSYYVKQTIDALGRLFKVRTCSKKIARPGKDRACLNYHIGRCMAPCQGSVSREEYGAAIKQICLFLSHRLEELIYLLNKEMESASQVLDFEKAARIRDQIETFKSMAEKQKVVTTSMEDLDVIACARSGDSACVQVLFIRGGKLLEREHYFLENLEGVSSSKLTTEFVKRFYSATAFIPKEILLQCEIDEKYVIRQWLKDKKDGAVNIRVPQRGDKKQLVQMAAENAAELINNFSERMKKEREEAYSALKELYSALTLEEFPFRIEAFDISNIQGVQQVGSMVVFEEGRPKKSDYRRYKLREGHGPDDYKSMREIVTRRYRKCKVDSTAVLPQLVLVDGGRGHVSSVQDELEALGLNLTVCGMVKDDRHKTRGIIMNGREVPLEGLRHAYRLVASIQDEAHRFAINYHRSLRGSAQTRSTLDGIMGIGQKRRKELLKHFGDISKIKEAGVEELASVEGMNRAAAQRVYEFFRQPSGQS